MSPEETGAVFPERNPDCEALLNVLFDGMIAYFQGTNIPAPVRGAFGREPDGGCSVSVVFPAIAHLTYTLMVRMKDGKAIARVETDTFGAEVNILDSVDEPSTKDLINGARELYRAIDMDIRRILFTNG